MVAGKCFGTKKVAIATFNDRTRKAFKVEPVYW